MFKMNSQFNAQGSLQAYVRAPSPFVSEKQKGSYARRESLKCCRRVGSGIGGDPFLVSPSTGLNRNCGRGPPGLREKSGRASLEETAFVRLSALF